MNTTTPSKQAQVASVKVDPAQIVLTGEDLALLGHFHQMSGRSRVLVMAVAKGQASIVEARKAPVLHLVARGAL